MGYVVGYSTSSISNTRRRGNVVLGVDSDGYDKTSVSGLYAGVAPVPGKHNIVRTPSTGDPDFYSLSNSELINFANQLGGGVFTVFEATSYLNNRNDIMFVNDIPEDIETDNLIVDLDFSNPSCFIDNQPTTNLLTEAEQDPRNWTQRPTADKTLLSETYLGLPVYRLQDADGVDPDVYVDNYQSVATETGLTEGDDYVFSFYFRVIQHNNISDTVANNCAWTWYAGTYEYIFWNDYELNTWYKAELKSTVGSNYSQLLPRIDYDNSIVDICGLQFEKKADATPYTTGSRPQNSIVYDLSGEESDGTLINGPFFNERGYLEFDGSNDYIDCGSDTADLIQGVNNITLGILFKIDTLGSLKGLIGDLEYSCTRNVGLTAHYSNFRFYNDTDTCYAVNTGATVQTGSWAYFVGTYDGTTTRVYSIQNGTLTTNSGTGKSGPTDIFSSNFRIMRGGSVHTEGAVAKAFAYTQTLTQEEILQIYYGGPIVTDGLTFAIDASNLVSYESGSTTSYSLTGSLSGSLLNGTGYSSNNGGTFVFDGTNDYAQLSSPLNLTNTSFSLDTWIKWDGGSTDTFFGHEETSANQKSIHWRIYDSGLLRFDFYSNSINAGGAITPNVWYYLLVTYDYDADICKCYKNGELLMQGDVGPYIGDSETSNTYIGSWAPSRQPFGGDIAMFRHYNRILSADEVLQNYNAQKARFI
jgi:hypothetical protein